MPSRTRLTLSILIAFAGAALVRPGGAQTAASPSDRERLIGAWHLVSLEAPGPDGKIAAVPGLKGTLIYTRDGHVSVQLMYPASQSSLSNEYVLNGYEASFGTYEVNEAAHTLTHHVQGSITRALVGKDLTRSYRLSHGRLIIRSVRSDEHWSVTWQHD
jgi:hypothetical protein